MIAVHLRRFKGENYHKVIALVEMLKPILSTASPYNYNIILGEEKPIPTREAKSHGTVSADTSISTPGFSRL